MKAKRLACLGLLALGVFYFFRVHAGDSISDFARRNFQFDLAQMQFGTPLEKFSDLKPIGNQDGFSWYMKTNSSLGQKVHASYGFKENILATVMIGAGGKERCDKIAADFAKLSGTDPKKDGSPRNFYFTNKLFTVSYRGLCDARINAGAIMDFTPVSASR